MSRPPRLGTVAASETFVTRREWQSWHALAVPALLGSPGRWQTLQELLPGTIPPSRSLLATASKWAAWSKIRVEPSSRLWQREHAVAWSLGSDRW
jgi:hypothetical protein